MVTTAHRSRGPKPVRRGHVLARERGQRGAVAVEFGILALLLFTLLFGIIQFGLWFWSWQTGAHAAREAARVAAVQPCDDADITSAATDAMVGAPATGTSISVTRPAAVRVGDEITIHLTFTTADLGFFPGFDGLVEKSATSRVENVPAGGC